MCSFGWSPPLYYKPHCWSLRWCLMSPLQCMWCTQTMCVPWPDQSHTDCPHRFRDSVLLPPEDDSLNLWLSHGLYDDDLSSLVTYVTTYELNVDIVLRVWPSTSSAPFMTFLLKFWNRKVFSTYTSTIWKKNFYRKQCRDEKKKTINFGKLSTSISRN